MAWRSSGSTNEELVDQLVEYGVIKDVDVANVMKSTDRKLYCRATTNPYVDRPFSIGYSATISAPHMHGMALELLKPHLKPDSHILDVGAGSGFLSACLLRLMHRQTNQECTGIVVGIEHHPKLVEFAIGNINSDDPNFLANGKIIIKQGDGRLGCEEYAPYDVIHVGAAAPEIPMELIKQLKIGGRMICPVGTDLQNLEQFDKMPDGEIKRKILMGVRYVPLTDLNE